MTDIQAAIAYFEDAIRDTDEIIFECSEDLQAQLLAQKRHFIIALEAMRQAHGKAGEEL